METSTNNKVGLAAEAIKAADALLRKAARQGFYNTSKLDFEKLKGSPNNIAQDPPEIHPQFLAQRTRHF